MSHYKPYTPEWHRKRNLREAIHKYLDDYVENNLIIGDILDILHERSETAYQEFTKVNELEHWITKTKE